MTQIMNESSKSEKRFVIMEEKRIEIITHCPVFFHRCLPEIIFNLNIVINVMHERVALYRVVFNS